MMGIAALRRVQVVSLRKESQCLRVWRNGQMGRRFEEGDACRAAGKDVMLTNLRDEPKRRKRRADWKTCMSVDRKCE